MHMHHGPTPPGVRRTMDDTDTLLALVSSLLTVPAPENDKILDTLVKCDGDVEATARLLNTDVEDKGKKRKRGNLEDWVMKPPAHKTPKSIEPTIPETEKRTLSIASSSKPRSLGKPTVDLMTVLKRPPNSREKIVPRLAPLMLSNPTMVAGNTPCTLHLSVLPPELACRLFYTMVNASRHWKRNKWWLFDRLVESPHRTSFFARKDDGLDGDETWQEAAQFWCVKPLLCHLASVLHMLGIMVG